MVASALVLSRAVLDAVEHDTMQRLALPLAVLLALLVAAWWLVARPETGTVEPLPLPVPVAHETGDEHVDIAGEDEEATRTHAARPIRTTVETTEPDATMTGTSSGSDEAELVVRVVSSEEQLPLAGIRLYLAPLIADRAFRATNVEGSLAKLGEAPATDTDGTARFVLEPGEEYKLQTTADDRIRRVIVDVAALAPGERRIVVLEGPTQADARFFGRLIGDEDQGPIAGARVEVVVAGSPWSAEIGSLRPSGVPLAQQPKPEIALETDADGRFDFVRFSWKPRNARITAAGRSLLFTDLPTGHETEEHALVVRMPRAASLDCRVVDAAGVGVPGIEVRVSAQVYDLGREGLDWVDGIDPAWTSPTARDGRCRLDDLPPGAMLTVELVRGDEVVRRDAEAFVLAPGEARSLELVLGAGALLRGRIVDQHGAPVARHPILRKRADAQSLGMFEEPETADAKTFSDEDGAFAFEDVPAGDWWVGIPLLSRSGSRATGSEEECASLSERVSIAADAREVEVLLRAHRGLGIAGRVVDAAGRAVGDCFVSAWRVEGLSYVDMQADGAGRFVLGPLVTGEYRVTATSFGTTNAPSQPTPARAGDEDVLLRLQPGGKIGGRVVDRGTGKPCDAQIMLTRTDLDRVGYEGITGTSTREGRFDLAGKPVGTYSIAATTSDGKYGAIAGIALAAGETKSDLEIAVEPGAVLRVRCDGERGEARFQVLAGEIVVVGFEGVAAGESSTVVVPAGALVVRSLVGPDLQRLDREIDVARGETREVVVPPFP